MKVTCYVFKSKIGDWDLKKTRDNIRERFFKNNMAVLFSLNGQVHGHYTSEFITRSLQMNLLKNHLLIHVNCSQLDYNFRKELFMASRDRLKKGENTQKLRKFLADQLKRKDSKLAQFVKLRKEHITVGSEDTKQLLREFSKSLPLNSELMKLLGSAFKLEQLKKDSFPKLSGGNKSSKTEKPPFHPQRFPSFFRFKGMQNGEMAVASIPQNGERILRFETDVENHYFDRIEEPGDLQIALLGFNENGSSGGNGPGNKIDTIKEVFNITTSSPEEGTIKVHLNPQKNVAVGDTIKLNVSLSGPGEGFKQIVMVKITDPEAPKEEKKKKIEVPEPIGLPELILTFKEKKENYTTWEEVETQTNESMDYESVIIPSATGDTLEKIFVNMDSKVLLNFKGKNRNPNETQLTVLERKYCSTVYFHTLLLYTITQNRKYQIFQEKEAQSEAERIDIASYLKDVFSSYYTEFLLNFGGTEELLMGIGE